MTDPENILQLGIEAVKEGNKEEARNLFRLLNQQAPEHVQGWLWLAGVAENRDERRAALERVLSLDPNHVVALKSLQVMQEEDERAARQAVVVPAPPPPAPEQSPAPAGYPAPPPHTPAGGSAEADFEDPFAELDSLSDVFSGDPRAVGRESIPVMTQEEIDAKPKKKEITRSHWSRSQDDSRKKKGGLTFMEKPTLKGLRPIAIGVVAVLLVVFLLWRFVLPMFLGGDQQVAQPPAAQPPVATEATPTIVPSAGEGQPETQPEDSAGVIPAEGEPATPEIPVPADVPQPVAPAVPSGDPAAANPAPLPPNTPLDSQGWLYDFQHRNLATPLWGNIGSFQPQGRYVHVLLMAVNNTGVEQPLPAGFVVLKDAQGRVYSPLADVSSAYVIRGVNADLGQQDVVPANGVTHSVALIFDVAMDASNLMLFSPTRPDQGWLVLERVQ